MIPKNIPTYIREPTPSYNASEIRNVQFNTFCQCICKSHCVDFSNDNEDNSNYCTVDCFHYMMAVARSCQYKYSLQGMVLYRGSNAIYNSEVPTLLREPKDQRKKCLKNLLLMAKNFPIFYRKNTLSDDALMFHDRNPILATIRILALVQHYSDVINECLRKNKEDTTKHIATHMLDTTKDVRVVASFAISERPQGIVRFLHVDFPRSVCIKNPEFWGTDESMYGNYIQRLGDTNMLLVDLTTILPASAPRPLNQSGFLLVHENHLKAFHTLRIELCTTNVTVDQLLKLNYEDAEMLLSDSFTWDALELDGNVLNVRLKELVSPGHFFHKLSGWNAFPAFITSHLYPEKDPMKAIIQAVARDIRTPPKRFFENRLKRRRRKKHTPPTF